jgi:hypothetical protein
LPENPSGLHRQLRHYAPWLVQRFKQQDGQEFLAYMLDALHEELSVKQEDSERVGSKRSDSKTKLTQDMRLLDIEESVEEYKAAWAWAVHLQETQSPIVDIFQGQLRSMLTCLECGFVSKKFDPMLHLSVPVKPGESPLSQALEGFAMEESLTDENRWHCERCAKRVEATKRMELYKLPPAIMLHLKRFRYDESARKVVKVKAEVNLPSDCVMQPLDLTPYAVSRQKGQALYDIVGIVNHHGKDADSGHYTAHCLHCIDDLWYRFDDDKVSQIPADEVWLPDSAYILFLMKRRIPNGDQGLKSRGSQIFERHVSVQVQSPEDPEHWPHMCDLLGIRKQLQLFNYMPVSVDKDLFTKYRIDYQRFRRGGAIGAAGSFADAPSETVGEQHAKAPSGRNLGPPFTKNIPYSEKQLAEIRAEYQQWRIAGAADVQVSGCTHSGRLWGDCRW